MKDNKSTPKAPEAKTTSHRNRHKAEIRAFPEVDTLGGIEMVHMMRKQKGHFNFNPTPSLKEQFKAIAA